MYRIACSSWLQFTSTGIPTIVLSVVLTWGIVTLLSITHHSVAIFLLYTDWSSCRMLNRHFPWPLARKKELTTKVKVHYFRIAEYPRLSGYRYLQDSSTTGHLMVTAYLINNNYSKILAVKQQMLTQEHWMGNHFCTLSGLDPANPFVVGSKEYKLFALQHKCELRW